jgi:tricorn protease-like protein
VGPDKSGCIYFYYTDTEGYSFEDPKELLSIKQEGLFMETLKKAGVRYIICDQGEVMDEVMRQLPEWQEYKAIGAFKIWTHR